MKKISKWQTKRMIKICEWKNMRKAIKKRIIKMNKKRVKMGFLRSLIYCHFVIKDRSLLIYMKYKLMILIKTQRTKINKGMKMNGKDKFHVSMWRNGRKMRDITNLMDSIFQMMKTRLFFSSMEMEKTLDMFSNLWMISGILWMSQ